MRQRRYCSRAIFAAASALVLSTVLPVSNAAGEEAGYVKVETAGERAHFAQAFCEVPPSRVEDYKARLRKRLPDVDDFDRHWQFGWARANRQVMDMNSLREHNPEEFASRIKPNCERLKWMADNSLRVRPQK